MQFLKHIISFFTNDKIDQANYQKASIKLSALITKISGSIGGTTFSNSPTGTTAKLKITWGGGFPRYHPPKKTALSQVNVWHGRMSTTDNAGYLQPDGSQNASNKSANSTNNIRIVSKAWGSLLASDRAAWQAQASTVKFKNKLGDSYTPNGFEYYMQNNLNRLAVGLSPSARPTCTLVKVIDDDAQETMVCFVCDGEVRWCIYADDLTGSSDVGANERIQYTMNGNTSAYSIIFCSAPMSPGRSKPRNIKAIAIIKPVDGYENFILRPALNKWFGKNLSNQNYFIKVVSVSPGGAQTTVSENTVYLSPAVTGSKIMFTEKTTNFQWLGSTNLFDFGSVASGGGQAFLTFLIYGIELPTATAYTIGLAESGLGNYSILYGDPFDPLDLGDLTTDKYGNIPPIPLQVTFSPQAIGVADATVTFTCGSETLAINVTGTGT